MSTPHHARARILVAVALLAVVLAGVAWHSHLDSRCLTCQALRPLAARPNFETAASPLAALGWTRPPEDPAARPAAAFQPILSRAPPA